MDDLRVSVPTRPVALRSIRAVWAAITADPPATIHELSARLDISRSTIYSAIRLLRAAGYIVEPPRSARARRVVVPFFEVPHDRP